MEESWTQWSLKRGVESLPESIIEYLEQSGRVQLHRDACVKQITPSASGWKVSVGVTLVGSSRRVDDFHLQHSNITNVCIKYLTAFDLFME